MNSHNHSLLPFDILHSDVWTSPVLSSLGHKYYVLFLDDYSKKLWTFPISQKSQVYFYFQKVCAYINVKLMEFIFVCLAHIHLLKMENLNEKYVPLTISFELCYFMHCYPHHFGIML